MVEFNLKSLKVENVVYLLVFLFPIAGMSISGWLTNIFNILVLIGLFSLRNKRKEVLEKEEVYFLWICAAYFSVFVFSSLANGWGATQTHYLGTELRFILIIPLYLLLREYEHCTTWLLRGVVISGFLLLAQSYYDVYIAGHGYALGVYSKNLTGPFAVLVVLWNIYYFAQNFKVFKWPYLLVIFLSVVSAVITIGLAGSRGAYVGFLTAGIVGIMSFLTLKWRFVSLVAICSLSVLYYFNSTIVKENVDTAVADFKAYYQSGDHINDKSSGTSTGVRLEMFRSGLFIFKDNFFTGIGPGNYNKVAQKYVKAGIASPQIGRYAHPHNAFVDVAVAKGILGLVTLLLLFYYPAYIFLKSYRLSKPTATLGLIHIVALSTFSLTDHSVVLMNNYTSILLLGIAIFLSAHIRACKENSIP